MNLLKYIRLRVIWIKTILQIQIFTQSWLIRQKNKRTYFSLVLLFFCLKNKIHVIFWYILVRIRIRTQHTTLLSSSGWTNSTVSPLVPENSCTYSRCLPLPYQPIRKSQESDETSRSFAHNCPSLIYTGFSRYAVWGSALQPAVRLVTVPHGWCP